MELTQNSTYPDREAIFHVACGQSQWDGHWSLPPLTLETHLLFPSAPQDDSGPLMCLKEILGVRAHPRPTPPPQNVID